MTDRALDAEVAKEVMGWELTGEVEAHFLEGEWTVFGPPRGDEEPELSYLRYCVCASTDEYYAKHPERERGNAWDRKSVGGHYTACVTVLPRFSTDIAAAWTVVEKMAERGMWLFLTADYTGVQFTAVFRRGSEKEFCGMSGWCKQAPEAICRAALAGREGV